MKARTTTIDHSRWRNLTARFQDYSYRHVWEYGIACAARVNARSEHIVIEKGSEVLGLADVRVKEIPFVSTGLAYINGGPLVRRGCVNDEGNLEACLAALRADYVERRGLALRILAPLGPPDWNAIQSRTFVGVGCSRTDRMVGYRTMVIDIARPLDEIRSRLAAKWRNQLNRAERNQLDICSGEDGKLFSEFCKIFEQFVIRKGFDVNLDAAFYWRVQTRLAESERFHVALAFVEREAVAGIVTSMLGDTCVYLLGASTELGRQRKASYLLQWHAIQAARETGCRRYDLGGIDPEANPGVFHFKRGMGGVDTAAPGPFEIQPSGVRRYIMSVSEQVYRLSKRISGAHRNGRGSS